MFGHNVLCCILICILCYFSFVGYPKPSPSPTDSQGKAVVSYKFFLTFISVPGRSWLRGKKVLIFSIKFSIEENLINFG